MPEETKGITKIVFNKHGDHFAPTADPNCNTTPPPQVAPNHRVIVRTKIGLYLGTIPVYLKPGTGTHHHLVIRDYGVMASVPKHKCKTFGSLQDHFRFALRA